MNHYFCCFRQVHLTNSWPSTELCLFCTVGLILPANTPLTDPWTPNRCPYRCYIASHGYFCAPHPKW